MTEPKPPVTAPAHDASAPVTTSPVAGANQLVVVVSNGWDESAVELRRFSRAGGGWSSDGEAIRADIGHAGLGWGIGLHGAGAPGSAAGPVKKEGDGRSPAGAFALGAAFGYDKSAPDGVRLPYTALDRSWRCVDDVSSRYYNDVIPESAADSVDWQSAETMRRNDELYRWVVLVDHNHIRAKGETRPSPPKSGAGSCIFFHVWRKPGGATVGCAAMDRGELESLMVWLDPAQKPATVMLPREAYASLKDSWQLPSL